MDKKIHYLQEKILEIYNDNDGNLPTFRDIAKAIKVSSTNTVHYHIGQLRKKGYLNLPNSNKGVVELNLKNLLGLDTKSGVYVFLKNKIPFLVEESKNIKKNILEKLINDHLLSEKIKNDSEKISLAYYFLDDENKRKDLKDQLINFYKEKNFEI
jgi:SOS-response transcriptional repressor LexA